MARAGCTVLAVRGAGRRFAWHKVAGRKRVDDRRPSFRFSNGARSVRISPMLLGHESEPGMSRVASRV